MKRGILVAAAALTAALCFSVPFTDAKVFQDKSLNGAWKAITELQKQVAQLKAEPPGPS
jgi:hypothetical protein